MQLFFALIFAASFAVGIPAFTTDQLPPPKLHESGPPTTMNSIPVPRDSWEPRTTVQSSYGAINDNTEKVFALATLEMNTTLPTVRLDNFLQIKSVECVFTPSTSFINLQFDSEMSAQEAFRSWSAVPEMGIIVGHEKGCNGDEVATFALIKLAIDEKEVILEVGRKERKDIVAEWAVSVTQHPVIEKNHLSRRDYEKNMKIPLDFNADAALKNIGDPFFWFLGCQYIQCWDCYTLGEAQVEIDFRGHFYNLTSYKMRVHGNFKANLNLKLIVVPQDETFLWWNYITFVPLTPFIIPGVFTLGPQFRIMGAVVVYADTEVSGTIGFDVNMPFDHEISSNDLETPVSSRNFSKTKFTYHPLNLIVMDPTPTYIGGHLMLAPEMGVGINIVTTKVVDVAIRIQNQIGFIHRYGNLTKCKGEKPSTEIFHRHKFQHVFSPAPLISFIYLDWDSALMPIKCFDCNSCADDTKIFNNKTNHLALNSTLLGLNQSDFMHPRDIAFSNITDRFNHLIDSK